MTSFYIVHAVGWLIVVAGFAMCVYGIFKE